ncbi:MAG: chloride channel protein [Anaerolineae bacterium]|nr:chloride channel protein [Anaerolineae bacterium]MEB2365085.1 chloride channel protein [Chloroflexota bacterium]
MLFVAFGLGAAAAVGVRVYRVTIEIIHEHGTQPIIHALGPVLGAAAGIVVLAVAGLIVGFIMERAVRNERQHGVAGVIESVALSGGRLPFRKMPAKALASAISLGAGASAGPEDPSVQIGSNLGSWLGVMIGMREDGVRLLVAAGAAAGIAAAFKAPIAGVFFALEVILNNAYAAGSLSVVILAAVVSSAMTQALDPHVEMGPFNYQLGGPIELVLFVPLGIVIALIAVAHVRGLYWQYDFWHKLKMLPRPVRTALAGAVVGVLGVFVPQALGIGRDPMNAVLEGVANFDVGFLLILCGFKVITDVISLGGGFVGGIFAPSLFSGTMAGAAFGQIANSLIGPEAGNPQSYAIAGMAGMLAAILRAPITAIMMVFELTNDYRLILPIMLTTIVCILIADRFEKLGIYAIALVRQGVRLQPGREIDMMQGVHVSEAMVSPAPTIRADATLVELRDTLRLKHTNSLCVLDENDRLVGIVTLSDLQRAYELNPTATLTVGDICSRNLAVTYPEDDLWTAIRIMSARDVGRLPVVKRGTSEVVGFIGRHGVLRAYNIAVSRKIEDQHVAERVRLSHLTGGHVYELKVRENAPIRGMFIKDVKWPPECVVASVTRASRLIVPHGSTELKPGDVLSIVADPSVEQDLERLTGNR